MALVPAEGHVSAEPFRAVELLVEQEEQVWGLGWELSQSKQRTRKGTISAVQLPGALQKGMPKVVLAYLSLAPCSHQS